ncbi:MAG TPA: class I SAM-dependent methyltransferase [Candidatus Woesebacteria bacterium]|nr:class I SAM-dependent methyltransferase [Candidatus Woesebacteria bacterium]
MPSEKHIESVKKIYNIISPEFSASRQYIWPDLKPFLSKVKPGSSILDVGCGNGRLLLGLPKNIKYTGLDISRELIKEAEKAHPDQKFLETDITKETIWKHLPQYDYIACVAVLHHLPTKKDQLFVLEQIKKHLKPKGRILITVWNLWQTKYLRYHFDLRTKLQNTHFVYIPFQGKPRFCFAFTRPYLQRLLRQAKLKIKIKKTPHNYLLS